MNDCFIVADQIWETMIRKGYDRSSVLVAFGGGVVGDLGGFIASSFMRGIKLVHIPTSIIGKLLNP